ncbi:MAG TPA: AAA family ATPase [Candidatus Ignatzschineria merdigallinarum]|uniref:AAA family ATPase n=1 Tax=Candidatus Ignatzschineria merdigallinarum TaxID=2838621 RepID=A0A9D1Q5X9_9GAMM|nr:AAA family ATPase [Candidatus Ignatzschineria merdigallinarum]
MRIISLSIDGRYKGLADQTFDFSKSVHGSVIAFIGLNGSGKSQLLELIAEIFALLERIQRSDFKVKTRLPDTIKNLSLSYEIDDKEMNIELYNFNKSIGCSVNNQDYMFFCKNRAKYDGTIKYDGSYVYGGSDPLVLPDYIVGYASGLHENLQRPFLKNMMQYHDVEKVKARREKELLNYSEDSEFDFEHINEINKKYAKNHKGIFSFNQQTKEFTENSTLLSKMIYLDYDNSGILLFCLILLEQKEVEKILAVLNGLYPINADLKYDVTKLQFHSDAFEDLKRLIKASGHHVHNGKEFLKNADSYIRYTEQSFYSEDEFFENEYLERFPKEMINFMFSNPYQVPKLRDMNYRDPSRLFERLFRTQLLGLSKWRISNWSSLREDNFIGTVKKPLKTALPLSLASCTFQGKYGEVVGYDDLSDGEIQFATILAGIRIFSHDNRNVLFLLDEPETHLNPAWRTYYNEYLGRAIVSSKNTQILMTTHSPFMISSLRKEQVYTFEKRENNIEMTPSESETFGTSFDVLIKRYFGLKSSISQTAVTKIKEYLRDDSVDGKEKAIEWINKNLGDSVEKVYLLSKLRVSSKTEER